MNDKAVVTFADALFNVVGRALLLGSVAGILLVAYRALAQRQMGDLDAPAAIAAGVMVLLIVELCMAVFQAKSTYLRLGAGTLTLLLMACAWVLAHMLSPFNIALWLLLGSSVGALTVDLAARRWLATPSSAQFLWVAVGAGLGSGLCLWLLPRGELVWAYGDSLGALGAIPAGTLICLALRARAPRSNSSGPDLHR